MDRIELKWGQTPWDEMSREDLVKELSRYHMALGSAQGVLRIAAMENRRSPYWGSEGSGGRALLRASAAMEHADKFDGYRTYFRYASSLLFPTLEEMWAICDRCQVMTQRIGGTSVGTACHDCACKGVESIMRAITWDDLRPLEPAQSDLLAACMEALEAFGGEQVNDSNRNDPDTLSRLGAVCSLTAAIAKATGQPAQSESPSSSSP